MNLKDNLIAKLMIGNLVISKGKLTNKSTGVRKILKR